MVDALTSSRGTARRAPAPAADAALAALDAHAAAILDAILHAPPFRALEAVWRGLKLLVDRSDFRQGIAIEVVSAGADDAPAVLEELAQGDDVDAILADLALSASERDLELASSLADAAEAAQTPVACAVLPEFLGLASWTELQRARLPQAVFDEAPYAAWRSLREREASRWIVLLANRVALRGAYGPDAAHGAELSYREAEPAGLLGSPVWALGSVLAQAFARSGACLQISGAQHGALLDLPLLSCGNGADPVPVEGRFSSERREDLERIGLTVLQHYQRDAAVLGPARSFHRPERYPDAEASADAAQQVTLPYQLFASRLVKGLAAAIPELTGAGSTEALAAGLREAAIRLVSTPKQPLDPQRVGIALEPDPDDGAFTRVALRVQPDLVVAGRPVNVMLRFRVAL
jgi:type VI secretion system protein ImpC